VGQALMIHERSGVSGLAMGSDPVLWLASAKNLQQGVASQVPPFYPALLAILEWLGIQLSWTGVICSVATHALLVPSIYLVARRLGASLLPAVIGAALALAVPGLGVFAIQAQPDTLTCLVMLLAMPIFLWFQALPSWRRLLCLALFAGVASQIREHGLIVAALCAGASILVAGPWQRRLARPVIIGLGVVFAPMMTLHAPGLPTDMPWASRADQAVSGQENFEVPKDPDLAARQLAHIAAHESEDPLRIVYHHAIRSMEDSRNAWLLVVVGFIGLAGLRRGRRLAALIGLTPALPALLILSQERHVLVAGPAGLAVAAAGTSNPILGVPVTLGALVALGVHAKSWPLTMNRISLSLEHDQQDLSAGKELCARATEGDLLGGDTLDLFIYCPLPEHRVLPTPQHADWKTWYLSESAPGVGWVAVMKVHEEFSGKVRYAWRLRPELEGAQRPCATSLPADGTAYKEMPSVPARLEPPCTDDPRPGSVDVVEMQQARGNATGSTGAPGDGKGQKASSGQGGQGGQGGAGSSTPTGRSPGDGRGTPATPPNGQRGPAQVAPQQGGR